MTRASGFRAGLTDVLRGGRYGAAPVRISKSVGSPLTDSAARYGDVDCLGEDVRRGQGSSFRQLVEGDISADEYVRRVDQRIAERRSDDATSEFAVGQVWRHRGMWRTSTYITISRVARRTVLGPMRIGNIPLGNRGQVKHSELRAKWERVA